MPRLRDETQRKPYQINIRVRGEDVQFLQNQSQRLSLPPSEIARHALRLGLSRIAAEARMPTAPAEAR